MRQPRVLIIGGGLAGLAAASALGPCGAAVTLLEARNRLGGRASSFQDPHTGQLIDTCQHVSMGCCTNLAYFCRTVGIDHYLAPQKRLYFMTPDRRVSRFQADAWPTPLHLARSFLAGHYLTLVEKLRVAWGLACLLREKEDADPPLVDWLLAHKQTRRTIDRFWGLVLVSALNESPDRLGLKYARKVFRDGFLSHPRGFEVEIPTVPLGELYGPRVLAWLTTHRVDVIFQRAARRLSMENERICGLELRDGSSMTADAYLVATPFDRLLDLLPAEVVERHAYFSQLRHLEHSPITSVHLWWDRPILDLPHVVLVDCLGQWVFPRRAELVPPEREGNASEHSSTRGLERLSNEERNKFRSTGHYVQVVVSAARELRELGHEEVQRRIVEELRQLFRHARHARLLKGRVITEHDATFSAVPGVDRWRPSQSSPIENLFVAGDWTATGWPATMEGAVRSGYLAAEAILHRHGITKRFLRPDLA